MTKRKLINTIIFYTIMYSIFVIIGLALYYLDNTADKIHYHLFKDLFPILITIPLAYLGFCFQRRSSFMQALRLLWGNLIYSVNKAISYTQNQNNSKEKYLDVLFELSKSIDEVRSVYKNLDEGEKQTGHYPFESLKTIYKIIESIGYGELDPQKLKKERTTIQANWKQIRKTFLAEFDRSEPTVFDIKEN
ncbi:MAG: hypothetical protein WBB02_03075 [Saprospiraceae bacterium]